MVLTWQLLFRPVRPRIQQHLDALQKTQGLGLRIQYLRRFGQGWVLSLDLKLSLFPWSSTFDPGGSRACVFLLLPTPLDVRVIHGNISITDYVLEHSVQLFFLSFWVPS